MDVLGTRIVNLTDQAERQAGSGRDRNIGVPSGGFEEVRVAADRLARVLFRVFLVIAIAMALEEVVVL